MHIVYWDISKLPHCACKSFIFIQESESKGFRKCPFLIYNKKNISLLMEIRVCTLVNNNICMLT